MTRRRTAPDLLQGALPFMATVPETPITVVTVDGTRYQAQQMDIFAVLDEAPQADPGRCAAGGPGCTSTVRDTHDSKGPMGRVTRYYSCPECDWITAPETVPIPAGLAT